MSRRATIALVAAAFAVAVIGGELRAASRLVGTPVHGLVSTYDNPSSAIEVVLAEGDGQIFGALAQDPALQHPSVFRYGPFDEAYRAQRPLLGYAAWAASAGRPGAVPTVMVILAVAGAALAAWGLSAVALRPDLAPLLVLSPAGLATLHSLTPELLSVGLALWGAAEWRRDRKGLSVALFTAAALGRETLLVFPLIVVLDELRRRRRTNPLLLTPFAVFIVWYGLVRTRLHQPYWPPSMHGDLGGLPFVELARAVPHLGVMGALTLTLAVAAVAVAAVALRRRRFDQIALTAVAYGALASMFGASIWADWRNAGRLLVPLYALGLALIPINDERRTAHAPGSPS